MAALHAHVGIVAVGVVAACGPGERRAADHDPRQAPDSGAAVWAALDTLGRLGTVELSVDSLVGHGDTLTVWTGPRVWMATDRPTSAVSVVRPARVVGVRHVMGG